METLKLKTNINCGSCVANVTATLDQLLGAGQWSVDTQSPNKILTIEKNKVNQEELIAALGRIGYKAEELA